MLKKIIFILFITLSTYSFSTNKNEKEFTIQYSLKLDSDNKEIYRGATLTLSNNITSLTSWGVGTRILNNDYSSSWVYLGIDIPIINKISIPINVGGGLKIKDLNFTDTNSGALDIILHGQLGLEWEIDYSWDYLLYTTYNYNLLTKDSGSYFINLGIKYKY
ncbi:MAG: hypothetical protein B6229_06080 [Spirochaetaceae bacterium 4572_7]|nr:MAG: hypothetical protein B6229_06080 [Spirochaetaceae bacterium 4572_7]